MRSRLRQTPDDVFLGFVSNAPWRVLSFDSGVKRQLGGVKVLYTPNEGKS